MCNIFLVLHPPPALQLKDVGKNWQGTGGCGGAEGVGDLGSDISGSRRHHSIVASSKTYFSLEAPLVFLYLTFKIQQELYHHGPATSKIC